MEQYTVDLGAERSVVSITIRSSGGLLTGVLYDSAGRDGWIPEERLTPTLPITLDGTVVIRFGTIVARHFLLLGFDLSKIASVEANGSAESVQVTDERITALAAHVGEIDTIVSDFEGRVSDLEQKADEALTTAGSNLSKSGHTVSLIATPEVATLKTTDTLKAAQVLTSFYDGLDKYSALALIERGDMIRFKQPNVSEYYNHEFVSWSAYNSPNWRLLADGRSSELSFDYAHRKIRLTYDIGEFHMSSLVYIGQSFGNSGEKGIKLTVEDSEELSTWYTKLAERTLPPASQSMVALDADGKSHRRYVRFTIEFLIDASQTASLNRLQFLTTRSGNQGGGTEKNLPFDWNEHRNISLLGSLIIPEGSAIYNNEIQVVGPRLDGVAVPEEYQYAGNHFNGYGFKEATEMDDFVAHVESIRLSVAELRYRLEQHGLISESQ